MSADVNIPYFLAKKRKFHTCLQMISVTAWSLLPVKSPDIYLESPDIYSCPPIQFPYQIIKRTWMQAAHYWNILHHGTRRIVNSASTGGVCHIFHQNSKEFIAERPLSQCRIPWLIKYYHINICILDRENAENKTQLYSVPSFWCRPQTHIHTFM